MMRAVVSVDRAAPSADAVTRSNVPEVPEMASSLCLGRCRAQRPEAVVATASPRRRLADDAVVGVALSALPAHAVAPQQAVACGG